jgi:cellulose synthase/poly-beta-1,6-N-acetylglucosamine synthase-like glycosyltransferase
VKALSIWVVHAVFFTATSALAIYGLHLYVLLILFIRRVRRTRCRQAEIIACYHRTHGPSDWPRVTTQIPVYNEADVVERVMTAAAEMDYPRGRHEIQILDDSDDHTRELVDRVADRLRAGGADVQVLRRGERTGYKAGALAFGANCATGSYLAIFDADFVPPRDFLMRAIPLLEADGNIACLQGRWDHLNREESWLTQAQALGIDAHFAIEQGARAWNGLMMNFNGTAGVWRKEAIIDPKVGGWTGDTLTEDLDLSYRAQLAGWKLEYCLDLTCPAELPGNVPALKSQQRRWATGSMQVARKLLPRIWRSGTSLGAKIEATLHLTHYSVAFWMLIVALVARPMLLVASGGVLFREYFFLGWGIILLATAAPSLAYAYARYSLGGGLSGFWVIPSMLLVGCGLCLSNSLALLRGLFWSGGEFVRTPKSGSRVGARRVSSYRAARNGLWLLEIVLGLYCLLSFVVYFHAYHRFFSLFLFIYAMGFIVIGWMSRPSSLRPLGAWLRVKASPGMAAEAKVTEVPT